MAVARHIENFYDGKCLARNVIPGIARKFLVYFFKKFGPVYAGKRISETQLRGTPMYCALACIHL